jgi:hypothetical protein
MSGISQLIEEIKRIKEAGDFESNIFFRGQRKCHQLLPSLLRKTVSNYKENNVYCDCWIMGNQEFKDTKNSWEILAILQHYGIPTRLLDWSTSIINALYFAISDCLDCKARCRNASMQKRNKNCKGNPIIWVIDSCNMIQKFYPKLDLYAFTIGIDEIQDYAETFVKSDGKDWKYKKGPVFLEIPWNNQRIKQQKGYFTFH